MSDPTDLVRRLTIVLKEKLRSPKNMAKGSWRTATDEHIKVWLLMEVKELLDETAKPQLDWRAVVLEAVDILAFAGMGDDPERRKFNEPPDTLQE